MYRHVCDFDYYSFMAWDEKQEAQVREALALVQFRDGEELGQIKMFGGLCFTLNGKMMVGVGKGEIMVRASDEVLTEGLGNGRLKPMDFTGKPLRNFAYVAAADSLSEQELALWIESSADFVRSQPAKKAKKPKARTKV